MPVQTATAWKEQEGTGNTTKPGTEKFFSSLAFLFSSHLSQTLSIGLRDMASSPLQSLVPPASKEQDEEEDFLKEGRKREKFPQRKGGKGKERKGIYEF